MNAKRLALLVGLGLIMAPSLQAQPLECTTERWQALVKESEATASSSVTARLAAPAAKLSVDDDWEIIDLGFPYTAERVQMFGSESAVREFNRQVVEAINGGFALDKVRVHVRLKWQGLVNYQGTGDLFQDHGTMFEQEQNGDCSQPFACLRRQKGVDGLLLGVDYGGGVAWGPLGVIGTSSRALAAHEVGHMFQIQHPVAYSGGECPLTDLVCQLGHGYEGVTPSGKHFSTVTGFGPEEHLIRFGGPDLFHEGVPTGKVGEAEGARVAEAVAEEFEQEMLPTAAGTCVPDANTLCLNKGRFAVQAFWQTNDGTTGQAGAVPLTADTGYFWFFGSDNVEVVTKVLDACTSTRPRYWVFTFGGTNVEVEVVVTDTETGAEKRYRNPQGVDFKPKFDTDAFDTCL